MSVHRKTNRWVVRWREDGRQRSKSFATEEEAKAYDERQRATDVLDDLGRRFGTDQPTSVADDDLRRSISDWLAGRFPGTRWVPVVTDPDDQSDAARWRLVARDEEAK